MEELEELTLKDKIVDDLDAYSMYQLRGIIGVTELKLNQARDICKLLESQKQELSILVSELSYNPDPSKADLGIS